MKFKPLHDRVLIEVLDGSEKTAGGIIIPDTAQEKPQEGKVVAVGGGAKTEDGKIIPFHLLFLLHHLQQPPYLLEVFLELCQG